MSLTRRVFFPMPLVMRPRRQTRETAGPKPETRELVIGSIGAQGDGLAAGPVFVPGALPGERVLAAVAADRAELIEVLAPSAERITPPCPHFGDCGGCALQHWRAEPYLAWKAEQIRLALGRERIETEILPPFAAPPGTCRACSARRRREPGWTANGGRISVSIRSRPSARRICSAFQAR